MARPPIRGAKVSGNATVGRQQVAEVKLDTSDEVKELVGDGRASVTAGYGLGDNAGFGRHKYEAFTSVTLCCNGDIKTVQRAQQLAERLAEDHLLTLLDKAETLAESRLPPIEEGR